MWGRTPVVLQRVSPHLDSPLCAHDNNCYEREMVQLAELQEGLLGCMREEGIVFQQVHERRERGCLTVGFSEARHDRGWGNRSIR
jgi:hypothetical protein